LREMVVYSRRKNKRNYLHLVSQMPKRKKNNFRAFEPISMLDQYACWLILFLRSFEDGVEGSQRNLYRC
jgi:hypothetical protein